MNIKTFIAAAVVALTAACTAEKAPEEVATEAAATEAVPANEVEAGAPVEAPKGDEKLK